MHSLKEVLSLLGCSLAARFGVSIDYHIVLKVDEKELVLVMIACMS